MYYPRMTESEYRSYRYYLWCGFAAALDLIFEPFFTLISLYLLFVHYARDII